MTTQTWTPQDSERTTGMIQIGLAAKMERARLLDSAADNLKAEARKLRDEVIALRSSPGADVVHPKAFEVTLAILDGILGR